MRFSFQDRLRAWLPLLIPLLLLGGSYWLSQRIAPTESRPEAAQRHDIDIEIMGVEAATLDEHGQPRYLLRAERMWHYPDDQSTHVQKPQLLNHHPDGTLTTTTAESGRIKGNGDEVMLLGEVKVIRQDGSANSPAEFRTSALHVLPKEDRAYTNQPLTLTTPRGMISAVGMEVDWKARVIKLSSNVRAIHEPLSR